MKTIRALSISLLLMSGVAAIVGGGSMLIDPSGGSIGLPIAMLSTTPFADYFIPGLILFVAVGVLNVVTGLLSILRNAHSAQLTILQGAILTGWIAIQSLLLQTTNLIQLAVGALGFTLFCLGLFQADEERVVNDNNYLD